MLERTFFQYHGTDEVSVADLLALFTGSGAYLRQWGDSLHSQFKHDVHCYHIVNIEFSDGSSATQNDMASGDVIVNAYPLDWELIYELSDSITPSKQK